MPSIGKYEYPTYGPKMILESLEKIRDSKVVSVKGVAQVLGHKTDNSGGFLSKLAAMSKYYKVIDRREENVELTSLGKRIAYPANEREKSEAIAEMILGIPIFRDLYERLGDTYDRNQFFIHLSELAGVDRDIAVNDSSKIRNIYDEVLPYLRKKPSVSKAPEVSRDDQQMETPIAAVSPFGVVRLEIPGKPALVVHDEEHYIDSLIKGLEIHKKELQKMKNAETGE